MYKNYRVLILINIFLACGVHAGENEFDQSIVNLWINELDQDTDVILLKNDYNFYIECELLSQRKINLQYFKTLASDPKFCLLTNNDVKVDFDEESQSIKLTVPTNYFDASQYGSYANDLPQKANLGGFLNYDFLYGHENSNNNYSALVELGIFKNYWIFKNAMLYRNEPYINDFYQNDFYPDQNLEQNLILNQKAENVVRLNTSLDIDFAEKVTRLTLGDTTTAYNPLINSLRFAGINWGTNFTERPNFVYWNSPTIQGTARLPSTVELYMNGVSIYNQRVSPGDYTLQTGAQIQRTGNAQIVVEDVLGNRSVQSFPIMVTNKLLREGLNEYNLGLGKLRYNYNLESNDYREFFANAYFRRGISKTVSLGTNILYSKDIQNLGLIWTQALRNILVFDSVIQASHEDENGFNFSYGLSLSKDYGRFSFGLSSKYTEEKFRFLGENDDIYPSYPHFENLIYFGITGVPVLENISVNYVQQKFYQSTVFQSADEKILNLGFNRDIGQNLSLGLSYFNSMGDRKDSGGILSLSYNFGNNRRAYFNQSADSQSSLQYVKNSSSQVGFDYAFGLNRRENENIFNFDGQLKTKVGDITLQHLQRQSEGESQLGYRGALVFLDGQFNFTKSVDNAFAVVKVGDYADIDILGALNRVEKTNKKGYAFVHDIVPYVKYDIAFDENQIPIETKIPYSNKQITTLNQRGYVVGFPILRTQQVTLRLVDKNGEIFPAGAEVHMNNSDGDIYPVSSDGTVALYGLIPGTYKLTVESSDKATCTSELLIGEKAPVDNAPPLDLSCK